MEKELRVAGLNDLNELIQLLTDLFTQDIEFEPDYEKQKAGLEAIIQNPSVGEILVLQVDGKILGMVSLLYSISTALGGKVAILEDMIVDKNHRNKGWGQQLLQKAIRFSRQQNCLRLTLLTDFNNDIAIGFYKSVGFQKSDRLPMRLMVE